MGPNGNERAQSTTGDGVKARVGRVGVFSAQLQRLHARQAVDKAKEWSDLGYRSLWIPEGPAGRDALTFASVLLAGSTNVTVATGVAVIWARDPVSMMNGARTIVEAYPDRFILGLGVSHSTTAVARGHDYTRPLSAMRTYLEEMNNAPYIGSESPAVTTVLGALGPRMVELAGELTDGVHPFLSTPDHTHAVREILGPDKLIAVEQSVVLDTNRKRGAEVAVEHLSGFVSRENYATHLRRMGFDSVGPNDPIVVDALYAIGEESAIEARIREHLAAGADHVCINAVGGPDVEAATLRQLASMIKESF